MAIIKFEANEPLTLAFTYAKGKEEPDGKYGPEFYRKTVDGDTVYLKPFVEEKLVEMGYRAKQRVTICKRMQGNKTRWEVTDAAAAPERPLAGQPRRSPAPAPTESTRGVIGSAETVMRNCLRTAVDLGLETVEYAKSKGHPLALEFPAIKEIAVTLYIQHSKGGNIRAMNDYRDMPHASDQDFAKAGSQAAANAVAQRKLEEFQDSFGDDGPPPPDDEDWPPPDDASVPY